MCTCMFVVLEMKENAQQGGYHRYGLIWELCLSTDKNKEVIIQIIRERPPRQWSMDNGGKKIQRFVLYY